MGTSYNPKIVTDGLVLNLDPANVKSYPAKQDPYVNNVSLMLSMDGANNSTTFIDSSQNALAVTAVADAKISTAQSKFGGSAAYFDGTGDYLTVANNAVNAFGLGDFTIECWVNFSALPGSNLTMGIANTMTSTGSATFTHWWVGINNNAGTNRLYLGRHGNGAVFAYVNWTPTLNTWYHIAVTRSSSSVISMFIDGVSQSVTTSGSNWANDFSATGILSIGLVATALTFNGYIDDFRLTRAARYTASFTPPTAPLSLPGRLTDLTTNKYNSTIVNGLTFDSSNSGSIVANTTNKYFTGSINSSVWTSNISMCAWFKHTGYGNLWESIFSANTSASFYGSPIMTFNGTSAGTRDQIGINYAGVSANGVFLDLTANHLNKWIYCVITISGTTATIYAFQNGILSSNSGTLPFTLNRISTSYYIFRHYDAATTQIFQGNIAKIELYNKALTVSEVIQNYNATKGRFGI